MRPHPWIVALAILLAGVMAFGTTAIVRQREARRLRRLPLPAEAPEPVAVLRQWVSPPPGSAGPPPEPEPERPEPAPPTGTVRLTVTGPHGLRLPSAEAIVVRQGDSVADAVDLDEQTPEEEASGVLTFSNLRLGRYDVTVTAPGMRTGRVDGVPTNGEPVAVVLERTPLLRGAVGRRPVEGGDGACAGMRAGFRGTDGGRNGRLMNVDPDDCTFAVEDHPWTGTLIATFTQRGRVGGQALLTVPLSGDPPFLCLAPPCADPTASLAVYVADTKGVQVESASIEWTLVGDPTRGELGMMSTSVGVTYLHGRRTGETLHLRATVEAGEGEATVFVGAGVTDVVVTVPAAPGKPDQAKDEEAEAVGVE